MNIQDQYEKITSRWPLILYHPKKDPSPISRRSPSAEITEINKPSPSWSKRGPCQTTEPRLFATVFLFRNLQCLFWHSPSLWNRCGTQEVEKRGTKRNGTVHRPMSHGEMEGTAGLVQTYLAAWVHDDVSAYVNSHVCLTLTKIILHRVSILWFASSIFKSPIDSISILLLPSKLYSKLRWPLQIAETWSSHQNMVFYDVLFIL